jgi:hypothetical protein
MSIETTQKRRFLETIYKIYYSLGSEPSLQEVSLLFGRYFSRFVPGESLPVPYGDLNASSYIDQEKLNRILVHTGFNIDVLYDNYFDEMEKMYEVISAFKFRMDNLRSRRAELEKNVDDKLFSINNTNGFYYAYTEAFNNTNNVDIQKTTAVVDTLGRKVSLPRENSDLFNYVGNVLNKTSTATLDAYLDGQTKVSQLSVDISNAFDGLNNTEFSYKFKSSTIGVCTLKISIPVSLYNSETNGISLVEGKIKSQKPVETSILVVDPIDRSKSIYKTKSSTTDYDNFSFSFSTTKASVVELYLVKVEPDYVNTDGSQTEYIYDFRIDELIIAAPFYSGTGIYVSGPIGLPSSQNPNLSIDKVQFDAQDQIPKGTSINYYIAADDGIPRDISQYAWIPVSPYSINNPKENSLVSFDGTQLVESRLVEQTGTSIDSTYAAMTKIPRTQQYGNPIRNYFYQNDETTRDFSLYRLAKFPKASTPFEPYILESVDKNQIEVYYVAGTSLDRPTWQQVLSGRRSDIVYSTSYNTVAPTQEFYQANIGYGSIYIRTNIFLEKPFSVTRNFLKSLSAQYWDVDVYLNGIEVSTNGSLSPGVLSSSITWNFNAGQNSIVIVINRSTNDTNGVQGSLNGTISLMEGLSLLDIPNARVYKNYLSYVKIEDLRSIHSNLDNVFSIIDWENNKEIVYRRTEELKEGSRVYYYSNNESRFSLVRVRADLLRGDDSYSSPAIISYTLKFKH